MARYSRLDFKTALPQIEKDIEGLFDFFYPVGTIYETSDSTFDPATTWGGTWTKIEGKVLVGWDEDDTDTTETFGIVGATGGARGAWRHNHSLTAVPKTTSAEASGYGLTQSSAFVNRVCVDGGTIGASGSTNNALNVDKANMPPYEVVVIWKRTA